MINTSHFALGQVFTPATAPNGSPPETEASSLWFIFCGEKLLVQRQSDNRYQLPTNSPDSFGLNVLFSQQMGHYGNHPCFLAEVAKTTFPPSFITVGLRSLFGKIDEDTFALAGRAIQMLHHQREHRFCGRCGSPMENSPKELSRKCTSCGFTSFPTLSPAVIMAVVRGDHILLGRASRFPTGMYSTLAGFVEPGETLEEAVVREVKEETNIEVEKITYLASQPWPFPHSIMIGFIAHYKAGEIVVDTGELEDAGWFRYDELPSVPSKITIARLLIDTFVESCKNGERRS